MKLKNKILSAIMTIAASMTILSVSAMAAELNITSDATEVKAGESFTITVSIASNPGITSFNAEVDADDNFVLSTTGATSTGLLAGPVLEKASRNPYYLNWNDGTATENNAANGAIATMTYTVDANATAGTYPITITSDPGNTMDLDWNEIDFGTATINITVVGDEPTTVAKYFAASFTPGVKSAANNAIKFLFQDGEKTGSTAVKYGATIENLESVVTAVEVKDVPADSALELVGTEWTTVE